MFNRKYIFKWSMFYCHVSFRGGNHPWTSPRDIEVGTSSSLIHTLQDPQAKHNLFSNQSPCHGPTAMGSEPTSTSSSSSSSNTIHGFGNYIYLLTYHKHQPHVGKYTIHGWYGKEHHHQIHQHLTNKTSQEFTSTEHIFLTRIDIDRNHCGQQSTSTI